MFEHKCYCCEKLIERADTDNLYYHSEDLEWVCEPDDDDPGVTAPKSGATPLYELNESLYSCSSADLYGPDDSNDGELHLDPWSEDVLDCFARDPNLGMDDDH